MATGRFVAYYRVSTERQGRSGLGLDAQRSAVHAFLNGGSWKLVGEFTEVETGKRADRPQLAEALAACRLYGATLVIAKLDRLARDVMFISKLMKDDVEFVALDLPQANRLIVHVMAAFAEHEAERISARTKAALAEAKRRGVKLGGRPGNLRNRAEGAARSAAVRAQKADDMARSVAKTVGELAGQGHGLRAIARELGARGIPTSRGGAWTATQVQRLLGRLPEAGGAGR